MFDWNDARYFLAIARGRTLSAAGRTLKVQQSTVGRRLSALEEALGARLFERTPEGYLLTDAGEAMLAHAERIEDEALSAERSLLGREGRIAGLVRMTAPQAFGNQFVVPLLARLHAEQPEIVVELVADNANLSLTKREADLALRLGRPQQPLLLIRRLGEVGNGLYAARSYLSRRGRPSGDLTGHDYIDYDETYLQKQAVAWFRQRTRGGRCTVRLNGSHGIAAAVTAGMGVGPLPCWLGDGTPGLERVLPGEGYDQELWLVMHRDLRHVARVRAVTDFFVRELRRSGPQLRGRPPRRRSARS
ncbi:MAG TPA: LysR family transcriptional regulator [Polyangia bacterium]|nr:LysR family transcriptional regulator [Polyangia bacterium]